MAIQCYEQTENLFRKIFKLDTDSTSYIFGVVDEEGFLGHLYYGPKLNSYKVDHISVIDEYPFYPSKQDRERNSFYDLLKTEYPSHNIGDFREDCISIRTQNGNTAISVPYESSVIMKGKPNISGLPASFAKEDECDTLEIICKDEPTGIRLHLFYSVFPKEDMIVRSVKVENCGPDTIYLTKLMSACLDLYRNDFESISLHGSWARERHIQRRPIGHGKFSVESVRGESSHQDHPFLALVTPNTSDSLGEVYAMHFVYSGNFKTCVQVDQFDQTRMVMGIHPENFCWKLESGDSFQSPEVNMIYSAEGLGKMSRSFHDFYRNHLIRSPYKNKKRPILINNWEATYFDFDTDKLISIAKEAAKSGIEMLVMDDGWFGDRSDDNSALGDWIVNEQKIKGGLKYLVDEVNKLGLKFGIWFEPEMISPDSDLYRAHPDWAIAIKGRKATLSRNQYVLDITRKEVRDYAYESVAKILRGANIEYVKWDMNRQLTDLGSAELPADQMGEFYHRYVLAVYEMQDRLTQEFPYLLLENCSGGGARFDPGMLYYSPQIWCSDDTDAIERLSIQEGTALIYPLSTMGAHVSDCPNHTVGRITPFETRGYVALAGTFGYELDITKISKEDRDMIPQQVAMYHKYNDLVREGDYYRIASYSENRLFDCYGVVRKDKKEALYTYVQVLGRANYHSRCIKLKGLDADKLYIVDGMEGTFTGDILMKAGILVPSVQGDFIAKLIHVTEAC